MSQGKLAYEQGTNRAADLGWVRCALEKVSRRYPEDVSDLLQMTGAHAPQSHARSDVPIDRVGPFVRFPPIAASPSGASMDARDQRLIEERAKESRSHSGPLRSPFDTFHRLHVDFNYARSARSHSRPSILRKFQYPRAYLNGANGWRVSGLPSGCGC